jgi:thiol:disulfide interchange protein DsbC
VFTKDLDQIAIPLGHARSPEQELAIFDDVDCPFCQKEHQELLKLLDEGWRVWVLLYPVESLHPHAKSKSISVWCAQDRQAALLTLWKTQQRPPDAVCHDPLARIKQLALRIPVTGTPTLVWKRGLVRNGFITAEEIKRLATQTSDGASTTLSKP